LYKINGYKEVELDYAPYLAVVDDDETVVDSDEDAEAQASSVGTKPPAAAEEEPKEAAWDFATEMKKIVFGLLDKGDVGLPWHSVLLFMCRDLDKETRVFKAFNVLGAPMYCNMN